ncbi:MAG: type II secretion system F family protein, partial [Candidatus Aenigmatarchaeota archaeon]
MGLWKKFSTRLFGRMAERSLDSFKDLKEPLDKSGMRVLFRTYVSMMFAGSFLVFVLSLPTTFVAGLFLFDLTIPVSFLASIVVSVVAAALGFVIFYLYPSQKASERSKSIKANLPFAINHMSAIASSQVPPYVIFKLLAKFEEYGEVSNEAERIIRNVDVFGQDITTSLEQVAKTTPSDEFEEFLSGMISTIKTGGNLEDYLKVEADQAMFD